MTSVGQATRRAVKNMQTDSSGEFIWVFGGSAAGKDTFIKAIVNDGSHQMRIQLSLKNTIAVCKESLDIVGIKCTTDSDRLVIIPSALELCGADTSVLIKWQFIDSRNGSILALKEKAPPATHRIFCLIADPKIVYERWQKRPSTKINWKEQPPDAPALEQTYVLEEVKKLAKDFPVTFIDSTTLQYREISAP